ncbi:cupin domain-containing protein [Sphingomonas sp. ST-64]|uniref:Cupin domain-containing protein n=1 Tax=Sphingomonas plantiphila TaxID=3163295 RepID=A0ABW8YQ74_9SPHN
MASEADQALRESARHRGLTLVKSRRRKPGGDFGKFGLQDADGNQLLGFGEDGLTAGADEIEAYLRGAMRSDWKEAAKGLPKRKTSPKPAPAEKPKPKPRLKKLKTDNLWKRLPAARKGEVFTDLLAREGVRVERIVSHGQATPEDAPLVQREDEWVILLQGSAAIRFEDSTETALAPGDHLLIPGGTRHWVTRTDPDAPTLWLAVHVG